ncbi:MAG: LCCL domain-containing protein [Pseudomonadota bacterium]
MILNASTASRWTLQSARCSRRVQRMVVRLLAGLCIGVTAPVFADANQPQPMQLEWNTVLNHFQVDNDKFVGQRFFFECPEFTVRDADTEIFGSGRYASDSAICVAAVHAGEIDRAGGTVTVQLNPGLPEYVGSEAHDVRSKAFPQTARSYEFVRSTAVDPLNPVQADYLPRLKWDTKFTATGLANRNLVGQRFAFVCPRAPGNLRYRRITGTDRYAFSSIVCQAAVHAGRITKEGGTVLVQLEEGTAKLNGSTRCGIESYSGSGGARTLTFPVAHAALSRID